MHKKRSSSNNLKHWEKTNRDHQVEAKKECGNGSSSHRHKGDLCALFRNHIPAQQAEQGFGGCHSCGMELLPLIRQADREMTLRQANFDGPAFSQSGVG